MAVTEIDIMLAACTEARERTLGLLNQIENTGDPMAVLAWRPGDQRAHIAWQLMHIGVTEELFATERLAPDTTPGWPDLVQRFRGGSTPDDSIPQPEAIRNLLCESREHLIQVLSEKSEADLPVIPPAIADRGWDLRRVLRVLVWHEAHHQGQAHITYNLWKALSP